MNRKDHILILSSRLLSAPQSQTDALLESFSPYYVYDEIIKPGFVSIGGDWEGRQQPLVQWLRALQEEGIKGASFEGADGALLRVRTEKADRSFALKTVYSPNHMLRPGGLVELIESQEQKAYLWERVRFLINEYNEEDTLTAISADDIADYILDPSHQGVYDALLDQFIEEIQAECFNLDVPLRIPPSLEAFFYWYEPTGQWVPIRPAYSWELHYFEPIDLPPGAPSLPLSSLSASFKMELSKMAAFAGKIGSPMKEAFLLGSYFLDTPPFYPQLDEMHLDAMLHDLEEKGFSAQALENTGNIYETSALFSQGGWPAEKIYGLFAIDISDVFEGEGSWNYMSLESAEDQAVHQQLPAAMRHSAKAYFKGLLSFTATL